MAERLHWKNSNVILDNINRIFGERAFTIASKEILPNRRIFGGSCNYMSEVAKSKCYLGLSDTKIKSFSNEYLQREVVMRKICQIITSDSVIMNAYLKKNGKDLKNMYIEFFIDSIGLEKFIESVRAEYGDGELPLAQIVNSLCRSKRWQIYQ